MIKNTTRKGLALGAAATLVVSAFSALPASAVGIEQGFISLAPASGDEYIVLAGAGNTFELSANESSTLTVGNLKFLVTDTSGLIEPTAGTDGRIAHYLTTADSVSSVISASDTVTIDSGETTAVAVGDLVEFSATLNDSTNNVASASPTAFAITAVGASTFSFVTTNPAVLALTANDTTPNNLAAASNVRVLREARNTTANTYVVDTGVNSAATASKLVLKSDSDVTREVSVVAWKDANNNDKIDSTEYVSPTRTVKFIKSTEVLPVITVDPVLVGDSTLSATITTNPVLNWEQVGASKFEADFTRQGSDETIGTDDSVANISESFDDEDRVWNVTARLYEVDASNRWDNIKEPGQLTMTTASATVKLTHYAQSGQNITFTTDAAHNLSVNDMITATGEFTSTGSVKVTAVTDFTFTFGSNVAATTSAKAALTGLTTQVAVNSYGYATAGTYTVTAKIGNTPAKIGATAVATAIAATAASVKNAANVSDTLNASFKVAAGHTGSSVVTATVKNAAGNAVGAGIPVVVSVAETAFGSVTVNGLAVTGTRTITGVTDANGQFVITVVNPSAKADETVTLTVTSQGSQDSDVLTWEVPTYSVRDTADVQAVAELNRAVFAGGSVTFNLEVRNQFGALLTGDARLKIVQGGNRYSSTTYANLNEGKVSYTLTDTPVLATDFVGDVVFTLQQKDTAGSWGDSAGTAPRVAVVSTSTDTQLNGETVVINVYAAANGTSVRINADGTSDADLSAAATTVVPASSDERSGQTATAFSTTVDDKVTVTGSIRDAVTGLAQSGHVVTVTGPSNVLLRAGQVSAFGSITFIAGSSYSVDAFSNVAQTDSVITVTANGVSATTKVSFTGAVASAGATLTVTAPATAKPGSTFQVSAKLVDKFGNPVDTGDVIKVTYTGPGLVFGTLPTQTDKFGELSFSVLLGTNDSGTATVLVSYDQNADGDVTDATDLNTTKTITVGAAVAAPSADQKLTVGSFKGFVAIYALNYTGSKLSAKVAGKWLVENDLSRFERVVRLTGAAIPIVVDLYIDGKFVRTENIVTK